MLDLSQVVLLFPISAPLLLTAICTCFHCEEFIFESKHLPTHRDCLLQLIQHYQACANQRTFSVHPCRDEHINMSPILQSTLRHQRRHQRSPCWSRSQHCREIPRRIMDDVQHSRSQDPLAGEECAGVSGFLQPPATSQSAAFSYSASRGLCFRLCDARPHLCDVDQADERRGAAVRF